MCKHCSETKQPDVHEKEHSDGEGRESPHPGPDRRCTSGGGDPSPAIPTPHTIGRKRRLPLHAIPPPPVVGRKPTLHALPPSGLDPSHAAGGRNVAVTTRFLVRLA